MLDLSIVIVSYNVRAYLLACLRSIYQQPAAIGYEVIVVDNVSTDGSAEAVRAAFPQVELIAAGENGGFAWGNNLGARRARGRYLLLLNPDTEVGPGAIEGLVRFADARPASSAYTCRLLNPDGTLQHSCFHFPNLKMAAYGFFPVVPMDSVENGRYPEEQFDQVFEPEHVLGACLMLRRETYEQLGGLDQGFHMYFEETDLCYRLLRAGGKVSYTPEFSVIHHGGRSTAPVREKMSVEFYRSQSYFYRKHYGLVKFLALKGIVAAGLAFWTARSCSSFVRGRIDALLLRTRIDGYLRILVA